MTNDDCGVPGPKTTELLSSKGKPNNTKKAHLEDKK